MATAQGHQTTQQPPKTTATGNLLDAGSFTLGCLESNALSMVLIAEFEKQQDLLRATNEALNKAKDFTNRKAGPNWWTTRRWCGSG